MRSSLPPGYHPSDDEEFMNPLQIEYFRQKLLLLASPGCWPSSSDTLQHLKEESLLKTRFDRPRLARNRGGAIELRNPGPRTQADLQDRRGASPDRRRHLRLLAKKTDEPIGIRRLEARPIATLTIEAQERHERMERTHRDD